MLGGRRLLQQHPFLTAVRNARPVAPIRKQCLASGRDKQFLATKFQCTAGHDATEGQQEQQAPAPTVPAEPLDIIAARNTAAASQVVVAAIRRGTVPALKDLLVEGSWLEALGAQFRQPYWSSLEAFVQKEWQIPGAGGSIYPAKDAIFRAYNSCPLESVRVVILGQDPYPTRGEAVGLSFSVPHGHRPIPCSLRNIYEELVNDCGCTWPRHGDLQQWAHQGVFLLNATLTVRDGQAGSHQEQGWEQFTDATIRALSERRRGLVFLLWGQSANKKGALIDKQRHHVLEAAHPAARPWRVGSSSNGFFGCRHFSKANQLLQASGMLPINWQIE